MSLPDLERHDHPMTEPPASQRRDVAASLFVTLLFLVVVTTFTAHTNAIQAGPFPSQSNPTRFAWLSDPQTLYLRPGNSGELLFKDAPTSRPSNLLPGQDEYTNAIWMDLDSPDYDVRVTAEFDASSTQSAWTRLEREMASLAFTGTAAFWVFDDDFISRYETTPALADQLTSQVARYIHRGIPSPAIILNPTNWSPAFANLLNQLRHNADNLIVGAHITSKNHQHVPLRGWDFIVYDVHLVPETYRGQAAATWVQSRHGAIPIVLAPADYDFQRDIIWIGSGVAGIWYPPLPEEPAENAAAAAHLRASTTFLNRFPATWLPLAPRPAHPAFNFTLEDPGKDWAAIIPSNAAAVSIPAPAGFAGKFVGSAWFNPATDQTIIQPLTRLPSVISVQCPDANLWIYTLSIAPPHAENPTHIAPIQDWSW